jgi:hypothetical protein
VIQTPYYPPSGLKLKQMRSPFPAAGARVAGALSALIETIFYGTCTKRSISPFP